MEQLNNIIYAISNYDVATKEPRKIHTKLELHVMNLKKNINILTCILNNNLKNKEKYEAARFKWKLHNKRQTKRKRTELTDCSRSA